MNSKGIAHLFLIILVAVGGLSYVVYKKLTDNEQDFRSPRPSVHIEKNTQQNPEIEIKDKGCENSFCKEYAKSVVILKKDPVFYFLDGGNIFEANAATGNAKVLVDIEDDILNFAINPEKKLIAYSYRESFYTPEEEDLFVDQNGNVVYMVNLETGERSELYRIRDTSSEMQVRELAFGSDSRKLIITSNGVRVVDLESKNVNAYHTVKYNDFCSVHRITDFNPDSSRVLIEKGCYEGSSQFVMDISNGRKVSTFENGYNRNFNFALAFINNENLLGYMSDVNTYTYDYVVFDLFGKKIKDIAKLDFEAYPYSIEKFGNKIFMQYGRMRSYEFNTGTRELAESETVLPHVVYTKNNYKLWYKGPEFAEYTLVTTLSQKPENNRVIVRE